MAEPLMSRRRQHGQRRSPALAVGLEQADSGQLLDGPEVVKQLQAFLRARTEAKNKT